MQREGVGSWATKAHPLLGAPGREPAGGRELLQQATLRKCSLRFPVELVCFVVLCFVLAEIVLSGISDDSRESHMQN